MRSNSQITPSSLLRRHAFLLIKDSILDIKVFTKSRKVIDVEIQLSLHSDFRERIVFYNANLITEQMTLGAGYHIIKKAISSVKIGKVVGTLREMSEDEIEHELAIAREKALYDRILFSASNDAGRTRHTIFSGLSALMRKCYVN